MYLGCSEQSERKALLSFSRLAGQAELFYRFG